MGLPERYGQSARNNECASYQDRQSGRCPEKGKVDDLPDHEKSRDVKADHMSEFYWRQIKRKSVSKQQHRTREHQPEAYKSAMVVYS